MLNDHITWLASFPKSGNTWLRSLLQAYRCGGFLDLNDLHTGIGDSAECYMRAVSPIPLADLKRNGQLMLRPAALLNALMSKPVPRLFKTHFANLKPEGVPAYIPKEFTAKAVYIVRDPRDVIMSYCKHFGYSLQIGVEQMANNDLWIGGSGQTMQVISSWSNHVASWCGEDRFPVHVVKYEDLMTEPEKELSEVIEFMGWGLDRDRVKAAVDACGLERLKQFEDEHGFAENTLADVRGRFFNSGGTRWQDELGPKWIKQIEQDHGEVMRLMGYLESNVVEIDASNEHQ